MVQFNLSVDADFNKAFLINRSELQERFEPNFYTIEHRKNLERLKGIKHFKLKELAGFSSESWNQKDYFEKTFPYIEIGEINLENGKIDEIKKIAIKDAPGRAKMVVRKNDIIVSTTRPTRGAIAYLENIDGIKIASNGFAVIRTVNECIISKELLFNLLRMPFCLKQMGQRSSGGNYPSITQEELGNIIIPFIEKDLQNKILLLFKHAYREKQNGDDSAKSMLASIDRYMLEVLGINLPHHNNTLENRIFTSRFSDVTGGRFDPKLYDHVTTGLKKAINHIDTDQFSVFSLKSLLVHSAAGEWGSDENDHINFEHFSKCMVIRATEFDNEFNIDLDKSRLKFRFIKKERLDKIDIKVNDLLIEKSGGSPDRPVGRIAILDGEIIPVNQLCYSNFIHKIRVDHKRVYPQYLFSFLKTIHNIKLTEAMQSRTNGIRNLIMSAYFNQDIILPVQADGEIDMNKQVAIANHIGKIRLNAKRLKLDSQRIMEVTATEVEKMIFKD